MYGMRCDNRARHEYVAQYMPDRIVADYLTGTFVKPVDGFFMLNAPSPAGFVGYSRAANWHDHPSFRALTMAQTADDVLAHAKLFRLTHIVYRDPPHETENEAMHAFRERYAVPIWRANGMVIAEIQPVPGR
jgi:hypothetical protein